MKIDWPDQRCIVCLRRPQADDPGSQHNKAHVLLDSIGARLWSEFLCTDCNRRMGTIEEKLLGDASVIELVHGLEDQLPRRLALGIISRCRYFLDHAEHGRIYLRPNRKHGELEPEAAEKTRRDIERKLHSRGARDAELFERLADYEAVAPGGRFEVVPGYWVTKPLGLSGETARRAYDEPLVPDVVPLGFAYLFLSCCIKEAIYTPELDGARAALQRMVSGDTSAGDAWPIEKLRSVADPAPLHGLAFEEHDGEATVRVVVFRWLVWRVHFPGVSPPTERLFYGRDLATGEEHTNLS